MRLELENDRMKNITFEEKQIMYEINQIKGNSKIYQEYVRTRSYQGVDEIGGHIEYLEKETFHSICPSRDYVEKLLRKCALELGVDE